MLHASNGEIRATLSVSGSVAKTPSTSSAVPKPAASHTSETLVVAKTPSRDSRQASTSAAADTHQQNRKPDDVRVQLTKSGNGFEAGESSSSREQQVSSRRRQKQSESSGEHRSRHSPSSSDEPIPVPPPRSLSISQSGSNNTSVPATPKATDRGMLVPNTSMPSRQEPAHEAYAYNAPVFSKAKRSRLDRIYKSVQPSQEAPGTSHGNETPAVVDRSIPANASNAKEPIDVVSPGSQPALEGQTIGALKEETAQATKNAILQEALTNQGEGSEEKTTAVKETAAKVQATNPTLQGDKTAGGTTKQQDASKTPALGSSAFRSGRRFLSGLGAKVAAVSARVATAPEPWKPTTPVRRTASHDVEASRVAPLAGGSALKPITSLPAPAPKAVPTSREQRRENGLLGMFRSRASSSAAKPSGAASTRAATSTRTPTDIHATTPRITGRPQTPLTAEPSFRSNKATISPATDALQRTPSGAIRRKDSTGAKILTPFRMMSKRMRMSALSLEAQDGTAVSNLSDRYRLDSKLIVLLTE